MVDNMRFRVCGVGRFLSVLILGLLLFSVQLFLATSLSAQLPTGTILGVVKDTSGGVVAGASVLAKNTDTNFTRTATTEADGSYRFNAMPIGSYEIDVSHPGFNAETRNGLTLTVTQEAVVNVTLRVGSASETVTVTEAAPLVDTTTATLGGLVNNQKVEDLPLNGRNYLDLTLLQTGVNNVFTGTSTGGINTGGVLGQGADSVTSNGAPTRSNNYLLDGAIMQNAFGLTPTSASGTSLGADGIQEFRVITDLFGAEYGLTMGSQTTIVSKGGTNSFHGDGFEFARNSVFDAKNAFDTGAIPSFSRNQFGGALGGPIKKDKTFFFATYEGLRQNLGLTSLVTFLPEAPCHAAAGATVTITNTPGTGCYDPSLPALNAPNPNPPPPIQGPIAMPETMNAISAQFINLLPVPNVNAGQTDPGLTAAGIYDAFTYPHSQTTSENYGQFRIDQNLSASDSLFGRYSIDNDNQITPGSLQGPVSVNYSRAQYLTASENHIFSAAVVNTARFSYSRFTLLTTGGAPALFRMPIENTGAPFTGGFNLPGGGASGSGVNTPQDLNQNVYTFSDDIFWNKGKHSVTFGVLINHFDQPQQFAFAKFGGVGFNTITHFIEGMISSFNVSPPLSNQSRDYVYNTFGFYVQDDWRVTPRLTLNLGLRYEPRSDIVNAGTPQFSFRNFPADNSLSTPPAGTKPGPIVYNDSLHNFSPRIGFAWDVFGDGKTAIRGGAGLYYDLANVGGAASNGIFGTPPTSFQSGFFSGSPVPICLPLDTCFPVNPGGPFPFASATLSTTNYHAKQPYLGQYNLTVERQLPGSTSLSVSYVGSRGIHLWNLVEGNPAVPDQMLDPQNPMCGQPTPAGSQAPVNCTTAAPRSNTPGGLTWTCFNSNNSATPGANPLTDPNTPNACRLNPYYGDYTLNTTTGDSWYNSLQVSVIKQKGRWDFQASYTFSKLIDDGQGQIPGGSDPAGSDATNPYNNKFSRGPSEYDATHQLTFNTTYHLADFSKSGGFASKLLNGWWTSNIVTARTGFAFSPQEGALQSNSLNTYGAIERPDFVTAANIGMITDPHCLPPPPPPAPQYVENAWGLSGGGCNPNAVVYNKNTIRTAGNIGQFFNPNMFVQQPGLIINGAGNAVGTGVLGDVPRGILRGPGFFNWDATIAKDTKVGWLGEGGLVTFRVDFFNILNHPNWAAPGTGLVNSGGGNPNSPFFAGPPVAQGAGQILNTANTSRELQLSVKVLF